METVMVWVLVAHLGGREGFSIPGIASEQACIALREKVAVEQPWTRISMMKCLAYEARR